MGELEILAAIVKTFFCLLAGCLLLSACSTTHSGTVSTVPWDDRSQFDGLAQEYGWGEDDAIYTNVDAPAL